MLGFYRESTIAASIEDVFAYHARAGALERLTPPWEPLTVIERNGTIANRGEVKAKLFPGLEVVARHTDYEPPLLFRDEQARGPFSSWRHTHRFEAIGAERTKLIDEIEYALPFGSLGALIAGRAVSRRLDRMFTYRHTVTALDNERMAWAKPFGTKRVAVTGASGLLGRALCRFLTLAGHEVLPVVRTSSSSPPPQTPHLAWDPAAGTIDSAGFEGIDAVVHLAGEPIGHKRWTPEFRQLVLASREQGTRLIARTLARLQRPPSVFVSASAVGYYGNGGDAWLDEDAPSGEGYLAEVCRHWEAASLEATPVRTVVVRIGLVLSLSGGPLVDILRPFRWGVGLHFGSGRQFMPWIGIDDVVGAIHHALFDASVVGPVNLVAPAPERNRDFMSILGAVLGRPAWARAPAFALRAALGGQKADELLLSGQRLRPRKLQAAGFRFLHAELEPALRHLLGRAGRDG
jgi:hypothetical protein